MDNETMNWNGQGLEWLKTLFYSFYESNYIKFSDDDVEWSRKRTNRFILMNNLKNIKNIYGKLLDK